jgi:simple sugar transport system substrate-binding protein
MRIGRLMLGAACAGLLWVSVGCGQSQQSAEKGSAKGKHLVVGFSQCGSESAWRAAETKSIKDEATKRGIDLKFSDAQGKQELQVGAIKSFIRQKVDAIILAPKVETGWDSVLQDAKDAGIPVVLVDRGVTVKDDSLYATLICSDFVAEGRIAAQKLMEQVDKIVPKSSGRVRVVYELLGSTGAAPAIDRAKGFHDVIDADRSFKVTSQNGDFNRNTGKQVMEAMLKTGIPDAVYAHNDDMAIGAIQAIKEAGKKPGKEIVVVSIDGIKDALQALIDGDNNAVIECNPLLGPAAFDAVQTIVSGGKVDKKTVVKDSVFDADRAKKEISSRAY